MTAENLKPCPWCKGKRITVSTYLSEYGASKGYSSQTYCQDCSAGCTQSQVYSDREMAKNAAKELWNTRPADTRIKELEAENIRLKKALADIRSECNSDTSQAYIIAEEALK